MRNAVLNSSCLSLISLLDILYERALKIFTLNKKSLKKHLCFNKILANELSWELCSKIYSRILSVIQTLILDHWQPITYFQCKKFRLNVKLIKFCILPSFFSTIFYLVQKMTKVKQLSGGVVANSVDSNKQNWNFSYVSNSNAVGTKIQTVSFFPGIICIVSINVIMKVNENFYGFNKTYLWYHVF